MLVVYYIVSAVLSPCVELAASDFEFDVSGSSILGGGVIVSQDMGESLRSSTEEKEFLVSGVSLSGEPENRASTSCFTDDDLADHACLEKVETSAKCLKTMQHLIGLPSQ